MNLNLPFLRYFKRDKTGDSNVALIEPPPPPLEKPASERFGKTVMPNSSRVVGVGPAPESDFPMVPPIGNPLPADRPEPRRISLGGGGQVVALTPSHPAPFETAKSAGERTIALALADIAPHFPAGVRSENPIDPEHRVLLKASELERGMANARPTVLLRSLYQQAPEFFAAAVTEADEREVALPFAKVLEQFTSFQLRPDQIAQRDVPQMDTPFLKMTLKDSERLGTPMTPVAAPASVSRPEKNEDPVEVVPPSVPLEEKAVVEPQAMIAKQAAIEPPKTVAALRLPLPAEAGAAPPAPLKISPNGAGVPAAERVPASSGPPVPTPLSSHFA
ncbi:MAG: hypothetical protein ABIR38_09990, partial [Chthoniobacterales bacterium]